jgi:UDP-N-acetylglucosamine--N-acetylmuramyl-(pentapeptide) pyrophosphoryl-undecaprenol N-acetylglucosamine transferase
VVEPNAKPGLANRLLARRAAAIAITFGSVRDRFPRGSHVVTTGTPVRASILVAAKDPARARQEAHESFGLDPSRTTVGVFGGSQGALSIDRAVAGMIPTFAKRQDLQLLVATGVAHKEIVDAAVNPEAAPIVRVHGFIERMDLALAVSDVVVSRAGASVAEIAVLGRPSILIPYPHAAENHQEANARELEAVGAAEVLLDSDLSPTSLASAIERLVTDRPRLEEMSANARAWSKPDAAERLADLVERVAA